MPVTDYSTDPNQNGALGTFNLGEGQTMIADFNGIARQLMADIKVMYNGIPVASGFLGITGGAMKGPLTREGAGAYLHHVGSNFLSGRIHSQPLGSPDPSGLQDGDLILEY